MKLLELNDKVGNPIKENTKEKVVYKKLFRNLEDKLDDLDTDQKRDGIIPKTR